MEKQFYSSEIHQFQKGGKNIILDVPTSRVFSVDNLAFDTLKSSSGNSRSAVKSKLSHKYNENDIDETLNELLKARLIDYNKFTFRKDNPQKYSPYEMRNIDLIISQDCNMRCIYCFADKGAFKGKRSLMSSRVGKKAIDFLIKHSPNNKEINVVFFGGEPMMNLNLIRELVDYGNSESDKNKKTITYSLSTNGTIINDSLIDFFNEYKIHVQISIDGDESTQNTNRPFKNRKGSYRRVKTNSLNLLSKSKQRGTTARTTISSFDVNKTYENVLHLLSMGFSEVHTETAEGTEGYGFLEKKEDYEKLKVELIKIANHLISNIHNRTYFGYNNLVRELQAINLNSRKLYSCGAGRGYVAVAPDGNLFPCHRFVGNDTYLMGNVLDNSFERKMEKIIHDTTNIFSRKPCSHCWARYFCGGDCIAVSESYFNNLTDPNPQRCDLYKHIITLAFLIYANIPSKIKKDIDKIYNLSKSIEKKVRENT